jgi:hypothetical protein
MSGKQSLFAMLRKAKAPLLGTRALLCSDIYVADSYVCKLLILRGSNIAAKTKVADFFDSFLISATSKSRTLPKHSHFM